MQKFKCPQCGSEVEAEANPGMCPTCNVPMEPVEAQPAPESEAENGGQAVSE
jgi:Zn finger protein HypA/HybF involved in hydrogenase expression